MGADAVPWLRPPPGEPPNLTTAFKYARHGIRIFPCSVDKKPLVADWLNAASADAATIGAWWMENPTGLVGLPMKHCDLLTVDCDRHDANADGVAAFARMVAERGLPEHPIIRTPNHGEHHVFRQPLVLKIGNRKIVPGVETRGYVATNHGGYIIGPGSVLPDGRGWRPQKGTPPFLASITRGLAAPSAWLVELCLPAKVERSDAGAIRRCKSDEAWLRGLVRTVAGAPEGQRNQILYWAACRAGEAVRDGEAVESFVIDVLLEAAMHAGLPRPEAERTVHSGLRMTGAHA
jgi:hypothetical protein